MNPRGTGRARIRGAGRIRVRQELLRAARAFDAEVGRGHDQRAGQIALHRDLPVLRVADAEIRDRSRTCWVVAEGDALNPLASVSGYAPAVLHAQALRERRLLRHLLRDRLIDRRVVVDAVAGANHQRRRRQRTPGDADARLKRVLVRQRPASRDSWSRQRPGRELATTGATAPNPRRCRDSPGVRSSSVIGEPYSQRTPAFSVKPGPTRQSSVK